MIEQRTGAPQARADRLERALCAALAPPPLPLSFHASLLQRVAREAQERTLDRHAALEAERRQQLQALHAGYLRLRRDTVLTLVAGAFTAGAAASVLLPTLAAALGVDALTILAVLGVAGGVGTGLLMVVQRTGLRNRLDL